MKKFDLKKWLTLIIISIAGSLIYKLPYLRETYYNSLQEATGTTNSQLGMLMSAYGLANFLLYFPGGWAADKFSARKLISFSCISTGLVGFYFATLPNFQMLIVVHAVWAITTVFTFWAAAIRIISLLGTSEEQGKLFGLWYFGKGLTSIIVGFITVPIFKNLGEGIEGLKATIIFYSIAIIATGVISYFIIEDKKITKDSEKLTLQDSLQVLKMPKMWLAGLLAFSTWSIYIGFGMVTPYLRTVFNIPLSTVATVSIIRAYVLFSAGGIGGSYFADKLSSRTKFMNICFVGMIIFISIFYFIPANPNLVPLVIANMVICGLFVYCANAVFFSIIDEVGVPKKLTGSAAGVMSIIAYFPEIFLYTTFGNIVDKSPNLAGYQNVFLLMLGFAIIGLTCGVLLIKLNKKQPAIQEDINEELEAA